MRQEDDTLTIDLYADPRQAQHHFADAGEMVDAPTHFVAPNKMVDAPAPKAFHSVKELEATQKELATIPENSNRRLAAISDNMLSLAVDLGVDASISTQDMIKEAAHDMANAATLLVRTGVRLTIAKEQCQHGEFENLCRQVGMQPQRAREAMSYAEFASSLDPKERDKYLMLPKKSALLLANAEPEVVAFLLEDGNEEIARRLRKKSELRELAEELADVSHALEKSEKEVIALHEENKRLKEAHSARVAGSEYPQDVVTLRKESSVLADEAIAALSSIRTHAEKFHESMSITRDRSDGTRNLHAALYPALANIGTVLRTANDLMADICDQYGLDPSSIAGQAAITFSQHELDIIEGARQIMLARNIGQSAQRQQGYADKGDLTRGRGRPRKAA